MNKIGWEVNKVNHVFRRKNDSIFLGRGRKMGRGVLCVTKKAVKYGSSSPYPWGCAHDPLSGLEPHAIYWSLTVKTLPLLDLVLGDSVAGAFNQQLVAPGAIGIGFFAHHIAEVDIT
jgi:hypothetical protein